MTNQERDTEYASYMENHESANGWTERKEKIVKVEVAVEKIVERRVYVDRPVVVERKVVKENPWDRDDVQVTLIAKRSDFYGR